MYKFTWILLIGLSLGFTFSGCALNADAQSEDNSTPTLYSLDRGASTQTSKASPIGSTPTSLNISSTPPAVTETTAVKIATKTPNASPTIPPCLFSGGRVVKATMRSEFLRLPLDYRVYLPPCHDQQAWQRYPLLILIHGQGFNDDQWERLGAVETADRLIASGEASPFIMLMPWDRFGNQPSESNFASVLVDELLPLLEDNYRTMSDRHHRAVGGLSRGAGWAVHLVLTRWDLFGALGAHSPAIFYDDAQRMRLYLDEIPSDSYPRIYLDIGDRDRPEITDNAIWFEGLLNERSIPHEWHLFPGFHEEAYWEAHIEQYLRWYTSDW